MRSLVWIAPITLLVGLVAYTSVHASSLTFVSDHISTSEPNTEATHVITFTATHAIPASGKIVITLEPNAFLVPTGFDYTDVDLAISSGGPYVERDLAASASATEDGVSVITGTFGVVTIALNSGSGIAQGEKIQIRLGTNATFGAIGSLSLTNPIALGSRRISLTTKDAADAPIDSASAMIAIVAPVSLEVSAPIVAPTRFNGLPLGTIAARNPIIELSLETADVATCRYATSSGVSYSSMAGTFSSVLDTLFYTVVSGHQDNTTYTYYVRCINKRGTANDDDYVISFTLQPTPTSNTSVESDGNPSNGLTGNLGPGGTGSFPNGSSVLYLASVTFSGWAIPGSTVTILKDGAPGTSVRAHDDGTFKATLSGMERGTYSFQIYAQDSHSVTSALYSTTLTLGQGTANEISSIVIPPTLALSRDSVDGGDEVQISGETIPNTTVEISLLPKSDTTSITNSTRTYFATSSAAGLWRTSVDTGQFAQGSYTVHARALLTDEIKSDYSKVRFLGVGESASPDFSLRADINKDGKVNLIDFSILLTHWQRRDTDSDINQDDIVNLADFSIMLSFWTG